MPKCEGSTHHVACDKEAEFYVSVSGIASTFAGDFRLCEEHMLRSVRNEVVRYAKVEKIRG